MIDTLKPYAEYKQSGSKWHGSISTQWEAVPLGRPLGKRIEQLFATKYKLILPSEEELRAELLREQELIADQRLATASHEPDLSNKPKVKLV
jgi:hypothetical protein